MVQCIWTHEVLRVEPKAQGGLFADGAASLYGIPYKFPIFPIFPIFPMFPIFKRCRNNNTLCTPLHNPYDPCYVSRLDNIPRQENIATDAPKETSTQVKGVRGSPSMQEQAAVLASNLKKCGGPIVPHVNDLQVFKSAHYTRNQVAATTVDADKDGKVSCALSCNVSLRHDNRCCCRNQTMLLLLHANVADLVSV